MTRHHVTTALSPPASTGCRRLGRQLGMGIANLLPFVDSVGTDVHLHDFAGMTAAIDGYYWLRTLPPHRACT